MILDKEVAQLGDVGVSTYQSKQCTLMLIHLEQPSLLTQRTLKIIALYIKNGHNNGPMVTHLRT